MAGVVTALGGVLVCLGPKGSMFLRERNFGIPVFAEDGGDGEEAIESATEMDRALEFGEEGA